MAAPLFQFAVVPPFRDIKGRFAKANQDLLNSRRALMREQGRRAMELMQDEAPKRSGEFADGIIFRTFVEGDQLGFKVYIPRPLGDWIIKGTKPHPIPIPRRPPGKPLAFWWDKGFRGPDIYVFYNVKHPGTKPNPFPGRAFRRWLPGARADLRKVGRDYIRTITGTAKRGKL